MATITSLTYNCTPESLGEVEAGVFAEALENEIRVNPRFRDCEIKITNRPALRSELVAVAGVDLPEDPVSAYGDSIRSAAERAFNHCCAQS